MSKIYRFTQPIQLSNGEWIGNRFKEVGPLGGEVFIDNPNEDNEIANKVREQCAKEEAARTPKAKKDK